MNRNWFDSKRSNPSRGLNIIRIGIALILAVHGFHGVINGSQTTGFGEYLSSIGFPLGIALAWLIMIVQILSSAALVLQRFIVPACICHITILCVGIILIHASSGWFVVGPGKNGAEYSITLIISLVGILSAYWPQKQAITV